MKDETGATQRGWPWIVVPMVTVIGTIAGIAYFMIQPVNARIDTLETQLTGRMDRIEDRMDCLEDKIDAIDEKLDRLLIALAGRGITIPAKPIDGK